MLTYVFHSSSIAEKMGGPKTYEISDEAGTFCMPGVVATADPERIKKLPSDSVLVASGENVKFVSHAEKAARDRSADPEGFTTGHKNEPRLVA